MIWAVLQVVIGMLYGNLLEWVIHKYILHQTTKNSPFSAHWYRHHRNTRQNAYRDPDYDEWSWEWDGRLSEVVGLILVAIAHVWVWWLAPILYLTLVAWVCLYYTIHTVSHKFPKIGKKVFRHHYDHHMGRNQNANWNVTFPIWDYILGTREKMDSKK